MMLRAWLRLVALLSFTVASHATTLVAVWSPERLVIGADSLVITDTAPASACKIDREGTTFFALSGLAEDQAARFSANALAHAASRGAADVEERVALFLQLAREPLGRALGLIRTQAPADYAWLQQGHPVLQVMFADVQAGTPVLAVASLSVDETGGLREYQQVIRQGTDRLGPRILYAGQQGEIRQYLRANCQWYQDDSVNLVKRLISLESRVAGTRVGGPVDIIAFDGQGARWVQKKAACGE